MEGGQTKRVLVTGGAGFVGTHLVRRLLGEGHSVTVIDNYFAGSKENHVEGADYREGHTKDIEQLVPGEDFDLIFHLGEYSRVEASVGEPNIVWDLNVVGTQAVLEFWRKQKCKLVYAGSSTKFGDGGLARDTSPYAWSKAANTELVKNYGEWYKLSYAITYFYNVFGPGERGSGSYATLIGIFREQYKKGQPLTVVAPGTQLRNFTHVSDIVDGLMLVGEGGVGDEYGLGNEKAFSVIEVARLFGTDIVMLPERQGNRMTSGLATEKSAALGWRAKNKLEDELYGIIHEFRGSKPFDKRVLVLATTFYPVMGAAEEALCDLMRAMPDVHFDIVTAAHTKAALRALCPVSNATIHRLGWGNRFDKFLLPVLGYFKARALSARHKYLFAWALTASYASLAALLLKRHRNMPIIVTLADQEFSKTRSVLGWVFLQMILRNFDQVFATDISQEDMVARISGRSRMRRSMEMGDAFANQLRFTYQSMLKKRMAALSRETKKRMLIFSLAYFPTFVGGAEVAIKELTDRMKDIEFHMVTLRFDSSQPKKEKIGNVIVHRVGFGMKDATAAQTYRSSFYLSKIFFVPISAWKAFRLHRHLQFDGAWAMMSYMLFPLVLLRFMGVRIPYVLNLQEGDPFEQTYERWYIGLVSPLLKMGFRNATVVQALSTFLAKWAPRFGFTGPIEVIPNAVTVEYFSHQSAEIALDTVREGLNRQPGDVWLVSTSRLVHKNAMDDVIRALRFLPPHVHFANFGFGPDLDALEALAEKEGVSDRVHLLPHPGLDVLPCYLQACDIFIRPSRSEGMGISFVEAMAAGLPVIATQEGGISDFLFDDKRNPDKPTTGWAVDKDSPKQIAEAVKDIIARPQKVKEVVAQAKKMVTKKYDWDIIVRDMREKVLTRLFDRRG